MSKEEDLVYIREHQNKINDPAMSEFLKSHPEKVMAMTELKKTNFYKKLDEQDKRFRSLIPYITNTKVYLTSITEQTKLSAIFLLLHKTIQTWEAILLLSKQGFYHEAMELSRSSSENMDLVNMFIFEKEDNNDIKRWFDGEIIGNKEARASFEKSFNSGEFFPENVPVAKIMASMYGVMSQYTHGGYTILLEMINIFTKDFDFDRSVGFYRLDDESDVFKNLVNKINYSLILFYLKIVSDKDRANELSRFIPRSSEPMSTEEIKKNYQKHIKKY